MTMDGRGYIGPHIKGGAGEPTKRQTGTWKAILLPTTLAQFLGALCLTGMAGDMRPGVMAVWALGAYAAFTTGGYLLRWTVQEE